MGEEGNISGFMHAANCWSSSYAAANYMTKLKSVHPNSIILGVTYLSI